MDYLIHVDGESLRLLTRTFQDVCNEHEVKIGSIKSTLILIAFIDKAKEKGLVEEMKDAE